MQRILPTFTSCCCFLLATVSKSTEGSGFCRVTKGIKRKNLNEYADEYTERIWSLKWPVIRFKNLVQKTKEYERKYINFTANELVMAIVRRYESEGLTNWLIVGCSHPVVMAFTEAMASKPPAAPRQCPIIDWKWKRPKIIIKKKHRSEDSLRAASI